ncbi:MAG: PEP-CTERM sorting domain-containing protein [Phycisphaerae bacterium]|nr:PEP-CTERM sorting domain-containing protein [Phycisphaerae bacterium]
MKKRLWKIAFAILFLLPVCALATLETREYLLGDVDGFVYNGPGSIDDVYVDPDWRNYWLSQDPRPIKGFDVITSEQIVPFTFCYNLAPNEYVMAATLTLGLRSTVSDGVGWLVFEGGSPRPSFADLNWYPISETGTTIRTADLAHLPDNVIPNLQDGLFSVAVRRHFAVDYAILTLEIIPEPATILLLALGITVIRRCRQLTK